MIERHRVIVDAYHFISEAIILFLITFPVFYFYYDWVPYWTYLGIVGGICCAFSLMAYWVQYYRIYMLITPLVTLVFYLSGFPFVLSIYLSCLLLWRYLDIRNDVVKGRETNYLLITALLSLTMMSLFKSNLIMLYLFLQFMSITFGWVWSHLAVLDKSERRQFNYRLVVYYAGLLPAGGLVIFWIVTREMTRNVVSQLWDGITFIIISILGKLVGLFQFLEDVQLNPGRSSLLKGGADDVLVEKPISFLGKLGPAGVILSGVHLALIVLGMVMFVLI